MRYYYDFEFLENGSTVEPISVGIVAEDDREYYAVNADMPVDLIKKHSWLMKNVWPHLPLRGQKTSLRYVGEGKHETGMVEFGVLDTSSVLVKPKWVIANEVREFLAHGLSPLDRESLADIELWANFGAYDHVALMQLWGPMIARPKFLPMWTHDLQYEAARLGVASKEIPIPETDVHNALADARWNKAAHVWLMDLELGRIGG